MSSQKSQDMGNDEGGTARETLRCLGGAAIVGRNEQAACVLPKTDRLLNYVHHSHA